MRDRCGSPDVVELRDVDAPVPSDDQVLVRVRAASVNRADLDGLAPKPSAGPGARSSSACECSLPGSGLAEARTVIA